MIKPDNYDWSNRLRWQIKESIVSKFYEIFTPDQYNSSEEIQKLHRRKEEFKHDITTAEIILKQRENESQILYVLAYIDALDEINVSYETHYSYDGNIRYECMTLNKERFTDSFMEFMTRCIDVNTIVDIYLKMVHASPFPYPVDKNGKLINFFSKLQKYAAGKDAKIKKTDLIIRSFHPSIYDTWVGDTPSASEAWNNDEVIIKSIKNRLMYKNDITIETIRDGLNVAKLAPKPSIFTTVQAIDLFKKYVDENSVIIDPTNVFDGKLLAALILQRRYIAFRNYGIGINDNIYRESDYLTSWVAVNIPKMNFGNIRVFRTGTDVSEYLVNTKPTLVAEIVMSKINEKEINTDNEIERIMCQYDMCNKYIFVTRCIPEKYKKYIVNVDKKCSHLYEYTTRIVIIDKE